MSRRDRCNLLPADPTPRPSFGAAPTGRAPDDLSLAARMLDALRRGDDLGPNKVGRLRSAIEAHSYDNELKLSVALDRMLAKVEAQLA